MVIHMARENKTKYAILGLLSSNPASGYDIKKRFMNHIGKFWGESYGQIYPIAKELIDDELITKRTEQTEGKPDRNVFSITDKGLSELKQWLVKPTDPHKERLEILLKLTCGAHISIEDNIKLIQHFKDEWISHLESYSEIGSYVRLEDGPQLPYRMMAVNCGMHIGRAFISWCDETIESLKAMQQNSCKELSEK